jgi:hypothetical protein
MKLSFCLKTFLPLAVLAGSLTLHFGCGSGDLAKSLPGGENPQQMKIRSLNNLKMIGLNIHNYGMKYKAFPPAYLADHKNGKPLLSWRVLLLPYLGEQELYKQFHLKEPWDSEHNKKLVAQMPEIYKTPGSAATAQGKTNYLAVRGPDSILCNATPNNFASVRDGLTKTVMVVEVSDARAVEWTRPDDFAFDPQNPIEGLVGLRQDGFLVLSADASACFIPSSVSAVIVNGWFDKSDGNSVEVSEESKNY